MNSRKRTNSKPKKPAATAAHAARTPAELTQEFEQMVETASGWCSEHGVSLAVSPMDAMRVWTQRDHVRAAVSAAGGPNKVPEAVLLYQQTLDDAANFLLAHGLGRALQIVLRGRGL